MGPLDRSLAAVRRDELVRPRNCAVVDGHRDSLAGKVSGQVLTHHGQPDDPELAGGHNGAHRFPPQWCVRLSRRRLTPTIATTSTGTSHQATIPLDFSTAVTTSPTTTVAAIVQSAPMMNSYQNRPNPITPETPRSMIMSPGSARSPGRAPAL